MLRLEDSPRRCGSWVAAWVGGWGYAIVGWETPDLSTVGLDLKRGAFRKTAGS